MSKKERIKKKEKFVGEKEKKGGGNKIIYVVGLILVGVILFSVFGSSGPEAAEKVTDDVQSREDPKTDDSKPAGDSDYLYIPVSKINDGIAHFYEYPTEAGKKIRFFVLKSSDGIFRAAFDACDVCYREGKGYRQEGDFMVCNNCGRKFPSTRINVEQGGCNPAPLERQMEDKDHNLLPLSSWAEDGYLAIKKSDIEAGVKYF